MTIRPVSHSPRITTSTRFVRAYQRVTPTYLTKISFGNMVWQSLPFGRCAHCSARFGKQNWLCPSDDCGLIVRDRRLLRVAMAQQASAQRQFLAQRFLGPVTIKRGRDEHRLRPRCPRCSTADCLQLDQLCWLPGDDHVGVRPCPATRIDAAINDFAPGDEVNARREPVSLARARPQLQRGTLSTRVTSVRVATSARSQRCLALAGPPSPSPFRPPRRCRCLPWGPGPRTETRTSRSHLDD